MLDVLLHFAATLEVLSIPWESTDITYEDPHVERIWTSVEYEGTSYRLAFHLIHPCTLPLEHPHGWPSAVLLLDGEQEMLVGPRDGAKVRMRLVPGASYEMTDPTLVHSVRPLGGPSFSMMVMGPRYVPLPPGVAVGMKQGPLTPERKTMVTFSAKRFLRHWSRS